MGGGMGMGVGVGLGGVDDASDHRG
jgi:hypothetical protein